VTVPSFNSLNSLPPVGLMGLFQIKSDGRTPRPTDALQFQYDATQFYNRAVEQNTFVSGVAIAAQGLTATDFFSVPLGRGWLVTGMNITATTTGVQYIRGVLCASYFGLLTQPMTEELVSDLLGDALAANNTIAFQRGGPILLAPDTKMRFYCHRLIAGPININASLRYIEFPWS